MAGKETPGAPETNGKKGRRPGQVPKYTIGILYAVAYRNLKKTPEQIAKFCKTDVNVVKAGLRAHGFDLEKAKDKQIREKEKKILKLEQELLRLKKIVDKSK